MRHLIGNSKGIKQFKTRKKTELTIGRANAPTDTIDEIDYDTIDGIDYNTIDEIDYDSIVWEEEEEKSIIKRLWNNFLCFFYDIEELIFPCFMITLGLSVIITGIVCLIIML